MFKWSGDLMTRQVLPHPNNIISDIPTPKDVVNQAVQEITSPLTIVSKIPTPAEVVSQLPSPKQIFNTVPTPLEALSNPPSVKEMLGKPPTFKEMQLPKPPPFFGVLPPLGRVTKEVKKSPLSVLDLAIDIIDTILPG